MVYDKKNALVIGFCPDERASNVINSIAVYSKWINLYFFEGDALPDPEGLLARKRSDGQAHPHHQRRRSGSAGGEGADGGSAEAAPIRRSTRRRSAGS